MAHLLKMLDFQTDLYTVFGSDACGSGKHQEEQGRRLPL